MGISYVNRVVAENNVYIRSLNLRNTYYCNTL